MMKQYEHLIGQEVTEAQLVELMDAAGFEYVLGLTWGIGWVRLDSITKR